MSLRLPSVRARLTLWHAGVQTLIVCIFSASILLFVGEHAELIDDMSRQPSEVQGRWRQLDFSRVGAREDQKALDEPREPVYLLQHAADDVAIGNGIKCVLQRHLADAAHRGEGGA